MVLRELLSASGLIERTQKFAGTMRRVTREPGGLLLVGTPQQEPWHLAAHLDDEARVSGVPTLRPTLVRYAVPLGAPSHLAVSLQRLEQAKRGETVFVVSDEPAPSSLLERAWDARKTGATVMSLDAGDKQLHEVAHESLTVVKASVLPHNFESGDVADPCAMSVVSEIDPAGTPSFDTVQHLVSIAAGEVPTDISNERSLRQRLAKILEAISGPRIN